MAAALAVMRVQATAWAAPARTSARRRHAQSPPERGGPVPRPTPAQAVSFSVNRLGLRGCRHGQKSRPMSPPSPVVAVEAAKVAPAPSPCAPARAHSCGRPSARTQRHATRRAFRPKAPARTTPLEPLPMPASFSANLQTSSATSLGGYPADRGGDGRAGPRVLGVTADTEKRLRLKATRGSGGERPGGGRRPASPFRAKAPWRNDATMNHRPWSCRSGRAACATGDCGRRPNSRRTAVSGPRDPMGAAAASWRRTCAQQAVAGASGPAYRSAVTPARGAVWAKAPPAGMMPP